ncbi:MAG: hypothetical protein KDD70_07500 [Bdellovibrionales bacterium]|nr:hypothetical protein [Bdellovibrionales bacterium]
MTQYRCFRIGEGPSAEGQTALSLKQQYRNLICQVNRDEAFRRSQLANRVQRARTRLQLQRAKALSCLEQGITEQLQLSIPKLQEQLICQLEQQSLELLLSVARHFLKELSSTDRRILTRNFERAMETLRGSNQCLLHLHPEDFSSHMDLVQKAEQLGISCIKNSEQQRGKALLKGPRSTIHLDWESEFDQVVTKLLAEYMISGHQP